MAKLPLGASSAAAKRQEEERKKKKDSGWAVNWYNELKLGSGKGPFWVILTPGNYPVLGHEEYTSNALGLRVYNVAYEDRGKKRYGIFRENAVFESLGDREDAAEYGVSGLPKYGGDPNRYWVNIVHLGMYESYFLTDSQGNVRTKTRGPNKGEPMTGTELVTSPNKRAELLEKGKGYTNFQKKYLSFTPTQWHHFESTLANNLGTNCKCGGTLQTAMWVCSSCGDIFHDVDDEDFNLTAEGMERFGRTDVRCKSCGHCDYPSAALHQCDTCDDPQGLEEWEVALYIQKTGRGLDTKFEVLDAMTLDQFEFPDGTTPVLHDDEGYPLVDRKNAYELLPELNKIIHKQYDFEEYIEELSEEDTSKLLNLPQNHPGYRSSSRSYKKKKSWR